MHTTHTLIISDVHLGSRVSRARDCVRVLKSWKFKRLILLGDIFDDLNFDRLNHDHWEFLSYIHELSKPENGIEIVWVEGNHDKGLTQITSKLVGVTVQHKEYLWELAGKKWCAVHGHQFDRFLIRNPIIGAIASAVYLTVQRIDTKSQHLSRLIKRLSKSWMRLSIKVKKGAIRHAALQGADAIICGHTHLATSYTKGAVAYHNTGCWTDVPSNLIAIGEDGISSYAYDENCQTC
jgi:UDP-2,3-diacylglucosamine pyrophosphatase LpxH